MHPLVSHLPMVPRKGNPRRDLVLGHVFHPRNRRRLNRRPYEGRNHSHVDTHFNDVGVLSKNDTYVLYTIDTIVTPFLIKSLR